MTEAAQDLAGRLRELKDRSGLSFGALAQRVHVGTSTLHRYCSGEAVPAEFAVIDRFGRVCGASREEMLALHRAWLIADAARTRGAEPAPEPEAPVEPPAAPPAAPEPPAGRSPRRLIAVALAAAVLVAGAGVALAVALGGDDDPGSVESSPVSSSAEGVLSATVRSDVWEAGCDHSYLIDRPPAQVPEPPVEADAAAWAQPLGAVDAGRTIVEVTLAGPGDVPVVLQGLTVRVDERRDPLRWNVYAMSLGCGGALTPASFAVDLDQPRPVARPRSGGNGEERLPAVTFPLRVSRTDPVVLRVVATTTGCDCDWHLELPWASGGRSGILRIDSDGRPFRTSGTTSKPYGFLDTWAR
ncbi:hypothetical protein GCM10009547_43540 [Sporichthya brevicatena]|uniref:HTH cro/C1-type domain-containing protein n=1 Tax=Sporichthya brevicatena TaxID=171442 RepID=A0ABN1H9T3_9ACTN